jgi:all-trans-retinol dehydrogenase (NAD+)
MSQIRGTNVLVTGGANGIGKLMGLKCLQEGAANLIIWDINEENLQKTAKRIFFKRLYNNVHTYVVDVSNVRMILNEIGN